MEDKPVSIRPRHSPKPAKQQNYTVICYYQLVRTIVTTKPSVVRNWVNKIRHHHRHRLRHGRLVVGLGVQWAPGSSSPASTLQLCVGHQCLVFQLLYAAHSPAALHHFLSDPDIIFVGVRNYKDAGLLEDSRHRLRISRLVDVRLVASDFRGCSRGASMETLASEILGMDGVKKEESVGQSDWDDRWLSDEQVEYACVDVFLSFLMAKALRVWNWVED